MTNRLFKTVLVVGENPEEIIKKYDDATKVEPYEYLTLDDAEEHRQNCLKFLNGVLKSKELSLTEEQRNTCKRMCVTMKNMGLTDYFNLVTADCKHTPTDTEYDCTDVPTAWSDNNPNAHYSAPTCPQQHFTETGEEGHFSNPFILIDGTKSYSAKKCDIDWAQMHLANTIPYERVWDMVVDGDTPKDEEDLSLYQAMRNRKAYFANFKTKEDYVNHSCSFWCYGIATADSYVELDDAPSDREWVKGFYEKYIEPLDGDTLLTIYEVRQLTI